MFSHRLAAAASLALSAGALASLTVTPIALTNHDDALGPGVGAGVHFGTGINGDLGGSSGSINLTGDIVFRAADDTSTGGNGSIEGVWLHSASLGTNTPIALTNWTLDFYQYGHSGFVFPIINNAGNTAWRYSTNAVFGDNGSGPASPRPPSPAGQASTSPTRGAPPSTP